MLVLAPGTLTQVDQAWTEPVLAALIVWWAVLVRRDRAWWAVVPLALACASKQHLALLLPVLLRVAAVRGWRDRSRPVRWPALLMLPWFLADARGLRPRHGHPAASPSTRSSSPTRWYLLALNELGVTLPFWVTGLAVLGVVARRVVAVWRRQPGPRRAAALAGPGAARRQPGQQAGVLQPVLAGGCPRGRSLALPQGEPAPGSEPARGPDPAAATEPKAGSST